MFVVVVVVAVAVVGAGSSRERLTVTSKFWEPVVELEVLPGADRAPSGSAPSLRADNPYSL
jgi:hypothetical protein